MPCNALRLWCHAFARCLDFHLRPISDLQSGCFIWIFVLFLLRGWTYASQGHCIFNLVFVLINKARQTSPHTQVFKWRSRCKHIWGSIMKVVLGASEQYNKLFSDKGGIGSQLWTIVQCETLHLYEPISLWLAKSFICKLQLSQWNSLSRHKVQTDGRIHLFTDGRVGL